MFICSYNSKLGGCSNLWLIQIQLRGHFYTSHFTYNTSISFIKCEGWSNCYDAASCEEWNDFLKDFIFQIISYASLHYFTSFTTVY